MMNSYNEKKKQLYQNKKQRVETSNEQILCKENDLNSIPTLISKNFVNQLQKVLKIKTISIGRVSLLRKLLKKKETMYTTRISCCN